MKKMYLIVLIVLAIVVTGCEGININIYTDTNREINGLKEDNKERNIIEKSSESNNEDSNKFIDGIKDKVNYAKSWYDENKDALNEKSKEILEEDTDNISKIVDSIKSLYTNNKEKIKESNKEIINNDINFIKDLLRKK